MTEMHVPGFDPVELLGYGSGGEVWLARERATGRPVALKRLRADADLAARDRLRREAAVLAGVEHPHVVRLLGVVGAGDGDALVLVLDLAPGGSLARLLATRRRLDPGEVVTLAVPLAQALAAVHAQGLVHGDVTPSNVLFAADGRPLLSDLGVAQLLGTPAGVAHGTRGFLDPMVAAGAAPGPASDVHGLAATCLAALTGTAPYDDEGHRARTPDGTHPGLRQVLEAALAPAPADRPAAVAFAAAMFDAVAPAPVRLDLPATRRHATASAPGALGIGPGAPLEAPTHQVRSRPVPEPAAERREGTRVPWVLRARVHRALRVPRRVAVAVAACAAAVSVSVLAGLAWAGADSAPHAAGVRARTVAAQQRIGGRHPTATWAATLAALDRARARAFAQGDAGRLRSVYSAGSPALGRDEAALAQLTGSRLHAEGLRLTVTDVALRSRSAGRVRLAVTDVMPSYRVVDEGGTLVEHRRGRGPASWSVVLTRDDGRWRVYDVVKR